MKLVELARKVDALGRLRQELNARAAVEKVLREEVLAAMKKAGRTEVLTADFQALLAESACLSVTVEGLRKVAGSGKRFLACLRVDLAAATRTFGREALEGVGTLCTSDKLSVAPRASQNAKHKDAEK